MAKLAVVTTHPIQYYAPLFAVVAARGNIGLKVFYTWGEQAKGQVYDPGFGKAREWDIPLLIGYDYEFVHNTSKSPGSHHFRGIVNPELISKITQYDPEAILVFGWAFQSHLKVLRHFKGKIPVLFRGDSTLLDEAPGISFRKIMRRMCLRWVYGHIDKALYVGTNNKKYYEANGVSDSKLVYAPHAIDNTRFADIDGKYEQQAREWVSSLGIPSDKPVVLFAGKLEAKKNPFFLVEAAKKLPAVHFIIVGNGILENEIREAAAQLTNITVLPFQNQAKMPVVYRLCDIFVLPSKGPGETWGLSVNEAMACGRVVVASNKCGGAIDLIENGANGYIIDPTPENFMNALEILEKEKSRLKTFKVNSLEKIGQFSFEKIAEVVERVVGEGIGCGT